MLKELFQFFINSFVSVINLMKSFVLDSSSGITFFHFLLFLIFMKIVIHVINYIKQIQEVEREDSNILDRSKKK